MFSQLATSMIFQHYPSMNHQINCLTSSLQEKKHPSNILDSMVINMRSCNIRKLPGICLMIEGLHYFLYALVVYIFLQVNMNYRENSVEFYVLNIYHGCICLCLEISIVVSFLLCIKYFSVIFHGHSLILYRTSDKNDSYLMESVSTLMPRNSNSPTRISLLSAVNAKFLAAMNSWRIYMVKCIQCKYVTTLYREWNCGMLSCIGFMNVIYHILAAFIHGVWTLSGCYRKGNIPFLSFVLCSRLHSCNTVLASLRFHIILFYYFCGYVYN